MKRRLLNILFPIILFPLISACTPLNVTVDGDYEIKSVNVYLKNDEVYKSLDLRFYEATPHVPYINVGTYTSTASISSVTGGDAGNYTLTNDTKQFTITEASITGNVSISGKNTYNQTLSANVTNLDPVDATLT